MPYAVPGDDILAAIDAPPTPASSLSPDARHVLLIHYEAHPPVALLARPFLRLAGVRVDPAIRGRQRTYRSTGLTLVSVADGSHRAIDLPADGLVTQAWWSPDGRRVAFTVDGPDRIAVWVADVATAVAAPVPGLVVSDVLATPFRWSRDSASLLAATVPGDRVGRPPSAVETTGPVVQETAGKLSQMATFQNLLASSADEDRFEDLATTRLARVDPVAGGSEPLAADGLVWWFTESPDGSAVLVHRLRRPYSYRVPYQYFSRTVEVWAGGRCTVLADLPVSDEVPRQGVPRGPRNVCWDERAPASLLWIEALDGGDPVAPAEHRDRVMRAQGALATPTEVLRTRHRCTGWVHLDQGHAVVLAEHDRDRRWHTSWLVPLDAPESRRVLFDRSIDDAYGDPGRALRSHHPDGTDTALQVGTSIFLHGPGASPEGRRPFLDRYDLVDGATERLHRSPADALETPVGFVEDRRALLVRRESTTEPPNLVVVPVGGTGAEGEDGGRRRLTDFPDPHPQLTGMVKQLRAHRRPDGVGLSGVLHLPPGHDPARDGRLPLVLWAYPREYNDAGTAGQVRGSDQGFTRLHALLPIWFVLRGYAVFLDATMPVIGDPETMNDTHLAQVAAAARAHIDALDGDGIIDRSRVIVGGHSYGGFMTANLLAHTDLFVAGIARSGAYNRTLTPFGFQSERRTFWEAPHVYDAVSALRHADKITAPLLLIHGAADDNPGTFPVQSERLFQALQGNGGTARLVVLPHEGHGYVARESVLHVLAEQFAWADRWAPATVNGQ